MKKIVSILLAVLLLTSAFSITAFAEGETDVFVISEDGEYVINCEMNKPVDISGARATVVLDSANIQATLHEFERSAIVVKDNSDVTFVLEGFSTLAGSSNKTSCGIEVEYGSKVTFEGEGTLNVTGGEFGAAIGSYGTETNIPLEQRRKVGEIVINSGNINAYAGRRGSGIGCGYHVTGNSVTINGGVIHAFGRECGAGIGTGYGTSGGANEVAKVGDYDAGKILITGGEIYAVGFTPNADEMESVFDYSDFSALNARDKQSFAAGIGGGYGSSASDIEITGGKIVALGSCGGAGIGSGRGSSKPGQYNPETFKVNIKIGGNADVTAITANSRTTETDGGAAAIGAGRGTHSVGNIEITDNAKVVAISPSPSHAIGVSTTVKWPLKSNGYDAPHAESIIIGNGVTLYAVSAGDYAVDKDAAELSISEDYFGSSDKWFFNEEHTSISDIEDVIAESPKGDKHYSVPTGSVSLWANIVPTTPPEPVVPKANLKIIAPLAMALRFEDGSVYYSGDSAEVEVGKEYKFQMCCVDWSTRDTNGEKKIHKPYETFYPNESAWNHTNHGIYSDDKYGLCGTVVYSFTLVNGTGRNSFNPEEKAFTLYKGNYTLRTDTNNCFMAYRFWFQGSQYNKQTGIDRVIYDTGIDHENTLEDFRYTKPLESLSVNLPLGSTITAKAYKNYEYIKSADVFVSIDENNPGECYKDYYWDI